MNSMLDGFFNLSGIINLVGTLLTIGIGILAYQKVPDNSGKLISIGAVMVAISFVARILTSSFIRYFNGAGDIPHYFTLGTVLGMIGHLLFLIGIFMLLKNLVYKEEDSE